MIASRALVHLTGKAVARGTLRSYEAGLRAVRRSALRVLVYTDSRGQNYTQPAWVQSISRNHLGGYVHHLERRFRTRAVVCPHRHTSVLDFLDYMAGADTASFDVVVMHCGVVDFSPRPASGLEQIRRDKARSPWFNDMFEANGEYHAAPSGPVYSGEPTLSLYSEEYLVSRVAPALAAIPNLVWVTSNRFVDGWRGTYFRDRPSDIDRVVEHRDSLLAERLPRVLDLRAAWALEHVTRYTVDNVHFSRDGFAYIGGELESIIRSSAQVPNAVRGPA